MSENKKLDRRHDCNAGEYLPQRLTRVLDMQNYWKNFQVVMDTEQNKEFKKMMEETKQLEKLAVEFKRATINAGDTIILFAPNCQLVKADSVTYTGVKVGPHRYGWELVQKPSEAFMTALRAEVGDVV